MAKIKYLFSFFILFFLTTEVFAANPSAEKREIFWTVQLGSFPQLEYACNFLKKVQEPAGRIEKIDNWYTVRCGLFKDRAEAENLKADLEKKGVEKPLVRTCYYNPDSPRLVVLQEKPAPEKTPVVPLAVPEYQKKEKPLDLPSSLRENPPQSPSIPLNPPTLMVGDPPFAKGEVQIPLGPPKGTISLDFKNADTRNVLRILAIQNNLNIIAGKEVEGTVTVHLSNVPLEDAFRSILEINGFGYEKIGDIFWVNTLTRIKERKKDVLDLEPLITEVFQLKYLGADDLKDVITKELSTRGSLRVLSRLIPGGWQMGGIAAGGTTEGTTGGSIGATQRIASKKDELPTVLVITDTPEIIRKVRDLIAKLDVKPKQILIEAMLVEVSSDAVKDIGIQWNVTEGDANFSMDIGTPSLATGLTATYDKTTGNDLLSVQIHALEENKKANVLSHPKIMALDGHEAAILVGESYPIVKATLTTTAGVTSTALDVDYQSIGISLRVIPRITEEGHINLLIHPEVTSLGENVTTTFGEGAETSEVTYPRIKTREADTNVTVKDGETVVIGGLKSEQTEENVYKIPFLGDIPLLGYLFILI